jgi:hypothetical protein
VKRLAFAFMAWDSVHCIPFEASCTDQRLQLLPARVEVEYLGWA